MPVIGFHLLLHLHRTITLLLYMWWKCSTEWPTTNYTKVLQLDKLRSWKMNLGLSAQGQSLFLTHLGVGTSSLLFLLVKSKNIWTNWHTLWLVRGSERLSILVTTSIMDSTVILTFQSRDVTSLLLGTSCPPSRIQCLSTNCVEPLVLFSLRFHILAVESPDL